MVNQDILDKVTSAIRSELHEKEFKSGKVGFGAYGKVRINGRRYQMSVNITEIEEK